MTSLFLYGTLRYLPLLELVLGHGLEGGEITPARLAGYGVFWAGEECYPLIVERPGAAAEGLLVAGLAEADLARLDFYEGGFGYALSPVSVETAAGPRAAQVYLPPAGGPEPGAAWDLGDWAARWGALTLLAAEEVMWAHGRRPAEAVVRRFPSIRARAQSRLNARRGGPATLRRDTRPGDVEILERREPYANFFAVEDYTVRYRQFDGSMGPAIHRSAFVSCDAATVLPYDPVRDRLLLIEQFRAGPLARGDAQCWSLEAIAGRIDPGETPEETLRREALEEAGLELGALLRCHGYYPSPGAKTEYIYSYLALTDLPDSAAGLGGLMHEGEDIRVHLVSYDRALALLESGEIENAPLVLSLLWLALNRDRLRAGA
ncbi:NUDIX domain-containing protein [Actibacterium sp. MT2.3-13A]|uniref:NUDIX domain-containing protein n=1 Tax=Actibacterium sp. MT2.3-13A TaxID=2828332 RepID=UPI001BAD1B28|nr:NUDIX domain-containing protein [Actibacterium sp. MT2.3-13A]